MKLLLTSILSIASILSIPSTASARIGETIAQATTRLGPPSSRGSEDLVVPDPTRNIAIYVWKRDAGTRGYKHTITVHFRNGKSFQETIQADSRDIRYFDYAPFLAAAGPGQWRQGASKSVQTNGTLTAIDEVDRLVIVAPPVGIPPDKQSEAERIAAAQLEANQLTGVLVQQTVTEEQDRAAKVYWLRGKVASRFTEGILVNAEGKNFPGNVLLTGHPHETEYVDGVPISARVKLAGTFQYRNALGGTHTIYKLAYTGEIPTPSTASK